MYVLSMMPLYLFLCVAGLNGPLCSVCELRMQKKQFLTCFAALHFYCVNSVWPELMDMKIV